MSAPLKGVKVLDLSRVLAGPYCTLMLADLGADVVKVESPAGDDTRRFGPPFVEGESTYFLAANRGKRSICVDLKNPDGRQVVHDLAAWADVAVENFRPTVAGKLGVGYGDLAAINARLIYASLSGYGHRGRAPYSTMPGYDVVVQGIGGIASLTGPEAGPPYKTGTSIADLVAGLNACGGILAALFAREQSGQGRHLDVSMLDGQLSLLSYHATAWLNANLAPSRLGNAHPSIAPYETFEAADGHFNIACATDTQFAKLCEVLGRADLPGDPRFLANADRVANRPALLAAFRPILKARSAAHWLERLEAAGLISGPIRDVPQALAHPQVEARGMIVEQSHPKIGSVRTVGAPLGFDRASYATRPPPLCGEHTAEVLREVLGYDDTRVAALYERGAVAG